jgi:hypothetical protein
LAVGNVPVLAENKPKREEQEERRQRPGPYSPVLRAVEKPGQDRRHKQENRQAKSRVKAPIIITAIPRRRRLNIPRDKKAISLLGIRVLAEQRSAVAAEDASAQVTGHWGRVDNKVLRGGDGGEGGGDWVCGGEQAVPCQTHGVENVNSVDNKKVPRVLYPQLVEKADRRVNLKGNKHAQGQGSIVVKLRGVIRVGDEHQAANPELEHNAGDERVTWVQLVQVLQYEFEDAVFIYLPECNCCGMCSTLGSGGFMRTGTSRVR